MWITVVVIAILAICNKVATQSGISRSQARPFRGLSEPTQDMVHGGDFILLPSFTSGDGDNVIYEITIDDQGTHYGAGFRPAPAKERFAGGNEFLLPGLTNEIPRHTGPVMKTETKSTHTVEPTQPNELDKSANVVPPPLTPVETNTSLAPNTTIVVSPTGKQSTTNFGNGTSTTTSTGTVTEPSTTIAHTADGTTIHTHGTVVEAEASGVSRNLNVGMMGLGTGLCMLVALLL